MSKQRYDSAVSWQSKTRWRDHAASLGSIPKWSQNILVCNKETTLISWLFPWLYFYGYISMGISRLFHWFLPDFHWSSMDPPWISVSASKEILPLWWLRNWKRLGPIYLSADARVYGMRFLTYDILWPTNGWLGWFTWFASLDSLDALLFPTKYASFCWVFPVAAFVELFNPLL